MRPAFVQEKRVRNHLLASLERRNILDRDAIDALQLGTQDNGGNLEDVLLKRYSVNPVDILISLCEYAQVPILSLSNCQPSEDLLGDFPRDMLIRNRMVPLARTKSTLTLAIADPLNLMAVEEVGIYAQLQVMPVAALEHEIMEILQRTDERTGEALHELVQQAQNSIGATATGGGDGEVDIERMRENAEEISIIRLVNMVLAEAAHRGASDVHLEPFEHNMRLRYRIDGVLIEGPAPPKPLQSAIATRLKVMADLNIAERRIPQDGRCTFKADGHAIDIRISLLPTVHGEKVVLRLLDKGNLTNNLDHLGLDPESLKYLQQAIHQPHGLILVTGPTGSGKTTTLYSALQEVNNSTINIVTVENPVEYQINGINQVEINATTGLTFATALRSILRQDPDVVLVGETRDSETAGIAVQAALTGHLVMTTLHTNDAAGAIARLMYMGVEPFLLASALRLAQAQRLVRRICTHCMEPVELTPEYCQRNHLPEDFVNDVEVYRGRGCNRCNSTGYKGRASIMEVLPITPTLRDLILKSASADAIRAHADAAGFCDLRSSGLQRVRDGVTTLEEVLRVTSLET